MYIEAAIRTRIAVRFSKLWLAFSIGGEEWTLFDIFLCRTIHDDLNYGVSLCNRRWTRLS